VSLNAQQKFFDRLSSTYKRFEIFPEAYHAIFHETNRREAVDLVRDFVRDCFAKPSTAPSLLDADKNGYTAREYERLKNNGSVKFAMARAGLKIAGRLSKGIDIGSQTGFDSGISLDYVYENVPQGLSPLGRLIDAAYLNAIGWRGIRQRKTNLKAALRRMIDCAAATGRDVHIIDIAAGTGRYVIETMQGLENFSISALLRDNSPANAEIIRKDAEEFRLESVKAEVADAFDRESLARIQPRATIGIVSGLYELFSSNQPVLNSLRGLADAIEPGGYLIYTNQPWHPQLEFIAHVLVNREGERWIMRRRTTAEMDELVRAAGFEKIDMEIDQWGMFTVSIARRSKS
jgi:SAM-dependent methyltransferase